MPNLCCLFRAKKVSWLGWLIRKRIGFLLAPFHLELAGFGGFGVCGVG